MDDLLALFEESPPEEPQPSAPDDSDDDETATVGDAARSTTGRGGGRGVVGLGTGKTNDHGQKANNSQTANTQQQQNSSNHVACAVDSRVDVRIKNRTISSLDLLDMIISGGNPYHSPAALAAMSLAQLNRLLKEPAGVVDMSTVQGKANIMTVGIVFTNSATRIAAASGNAFCILTIGTLRTGPAVTLLLFGSAYGQHVQQCKPGMIVAVSSPKLVPPKPGGSSSSSDTAITFTLNDARQISLLGESEDYAICQGRMRGKNEAGAWVSDAKRCRTVVDKRVCLYCPLHRGQLNNHTVNPTMNKGTLKMQALRLESTMAATNVSMQGSGRRMILPQNSIPPHHPMKHPALQQGNNNLRSENNHSRSEDMLAEYLTRQSAGHGFSSLSSSLILPSASQNRLLTASNQQRSLVPTAGQQRSIVGKAPCPIQKTQKSNGNSLLNPYSKKQVVPNTTSLIGGTMKSQATTMMQSAVQQQRQIFATKGGNKIASNKLQDLQNILQPPLKRNVTSTTTTASKRPRKAINTVSLQGFDGSVVVPKPKPIFAASRHAAGSNTGAGQCFATNSSCTQQQLQQEHNASIQASAIRAKQEQMAARLREKQQQQHQRGIAVQGRNRQEEHHNSTAALRDSLFGTPLDDAKREELLQAKSQFADEAKSEEYARSRKVVVELEKQEEKQTNKSSSNNNNHKKNKQAEAKIQKQWHCRTCGKSYANRPRMCEQANHRVVLCREIQKQKSTAETRSDLSNKDAQDGGLKLGSGIAWSYSRYN